MKEHWRLFAPMSVVMISTLDVSGFTRCSPFSWVVPLNKHACFGVMMRLSSKTLEHLQRDKPYFSLSWLPPTPEAGETALMATKGFNSIALMEHPEINFKIPTIAVAAANAKKLSVVSTGGVSPKTHLLVVCELLSFYLLAPIEDGFLPLMHFGYKTFADPKPFTVEGY